MSRGIRKGHNVENEFVSVRATERGERKKSKVKGNLWEGAGSNLSRGIRKEHNFENEVVSVRATERREREESKVKEIK